MEVLMYVQDRVLSPLSSSAFAIVGLADQLAEAGGPRVGASRNEDGSLPPADC